LLTIGGDVAWDEAEALARTVVDDRALPGGTTALAHGDLFALAETVAGLTGGSVTVEDAAHRVLAYSQTDEYADELRRMTIMGRTCPEEYLKVLRAWGVWDRLREPDEVVRVDAHPGLGIRARLVTAVRSGPRLLGTIWLHEDGEPLDASAADVLRGAARVAAVRLAEGPGAGADGDDSASAELLSGVLDERVPAALLAGRLGLPADAPAALVALDPRVPGDGAGAGPRAEARRVAAVHAAAYRRTALPGWCDGRLFLLLPDAGEPSGTAAGTVVSRSAVEWAAGLVAAVRARLGGAAQAAVVRLARLDDAAAARREAERVLTALAKEPDRRLATAHEMRATLAVNTVLDLIDQHPQTHDGALDALVAQDRRQGTALAESLLRYLEGFGETTPVARGLHIHPNTLRYRVHRAATLAGLDLADPEHRLLAQLHLRRSLRRSG
ncbi:helix-turn-helix domain-containing protein, partial [Streptomyces beihaiensis]